MILRLGLDLGSSAVKAVLVDEAGQEQYRGTAPSMGTPLTALGALVDAISRAYPGRDARVALSGVARGLCAQQLETATLVSDVVALAAGAQHHKPAIGDVISLGGQHSIWCRLGSGRLGSFSQFELSDQCAAGAGSFLEQQAERLGMKIDEFSRAAATAKRAPAVAGRCAVFTKSDLIHLQQKGTPIDEVALGLCHALVRTFQAQVVHGRPLKLPVLLVGGCAKNQGMVRAVSEVFNLGAEELVIADEPEYVSALGTALLADGAPRGLASVLESIRAAALGGKSWKTVAPLPLSIELAEAAEPRGEGLDDAEVILGIDVGSVSTNLALVDKNGKLRDSAYVRTRGKPLEAVRQALASIISRHPQPINVVGAGATGSGRHLAGHLIGVDLVKNEIAAQLRAAAAFRPDVDTVFEIGGQDAKYIRAEQGTLVDFAMNRLCAAGTGSFLEEQADSLGIAIVDEFAHRAMAAKAPLDFGCRCTVFMETEAATAAASGASVDDIAAGLALSVARNYLSRVVGNRRVGKHIVFQGGTASNRAVVAALEWLLGQQLLVHPHRRVSGAFGIALLVLEAQNQGLIHGPSRFRGFVCSAGALERSFECAHCSASCQVTQFRAKDSVFYFGDVCERYSSRDGQEKATLDPLTRRSELLISTSGIEDWPDSVPANAIGFPRASHSYALLPWLVALARAAGRVPLLSPPTTPKTLAAGARHLSADCCLPIKAAYGHVVELVERGVGQLLMPSLGTFAGDEGLAHSCLFGHHLPAMLAGSVAQIEVISPEISLDYPRGRRVDSLAEAGTCLGLSKRDVERALDEGDAAARRLREALQDWGREVLGQGHERIIVVIARPYLLCDSTLNMAVGRHLARLGLTVLPADALPLDTVALDERWQDLPWQYAREQIRAALLIQDDDRLFPVILTSFGCGPDAFTLKHLEQLFGARPHLILELDEHRSEAGLVTRLEAFSDEIAEYQRRGIKAKSVGRAPLLRLKKRGHLVMPYYADHAHGQAGVLRAAGFDVTLLAPPSEATRERGESLVSGRECHPFAMVAGDLVASMERGTIGPDSAFVMPGTVVSCLLRQYADGLDMLLERLGAGRVRMVSLSLDTLPKLVGLPLAIRLGAAYAATDMLLRARCRIRPYEIQRGQTDEVYRASLAQLGEAAEAGSLWDTLGEIAARFAAIERTTVVRPVVGVAGDVYTRVNDFASDELFRVLENAGCEVWPAPFGNDVAEYNATRRVQLAWRLRRPRWGIRFSLFGRIFTGHRQRLQKIFAGIDGLLPELSVKAIQELVHPHLGTAANPLVVLNIGRMLMYANAGADGVLNAYCNNCMVGSVTEALGARIQREMRQIPVANLVYGDGTGSANRTRIEAFVHQVKAFHAERQRAMQAAKAGAQ